MRRKIIAIDESKCAGCGLCAEACHGGAIGMADGKAKLLRAECCDGLGNCLPVCPAGAIAFVEREAEQCAEKYEGKYEGKYEEKYEEKYDDEAVQAPLRRMPHQGPCPGSNARLIVRAAANSPAEASAAVSELRQWPVQIKLVPEKALYFDGADLLVAADCAAYARAQFHAEYMRGKITIIGCPKLDGANYSIKLTRIIRNNTIKSLTIARMEVPCCGGIEQAVIVALKNSRKRIPCRIVTLGIDGGIRGDSSADLLPGNGYAAREYEDKRKTACDANAELQV